MKSGSTLRRIWNLAALLLVSALVTSSPALAAGKKADKKPAAKSAAKKTTGKTAPKTAKKSVKAAAKKITYIDHVRPILRQKCFSCHNLDKKSGGLDMTSYTNLMQGGGSGEVVESGDPESSYLFMLVTHESEPFMPPKSDKLPKKMLATIKQWIKGGVLETSGSKARISKKPAFDLGLKSTPSGKPAGPPPMPGRLGLEPVVHTRRTTAVTAVATSPWAPLAAVAGQKQVLLYHTQTLELLGVLPFPEGIAHVLKFSRNGSLLLAGGGHGASRGRVVVWNVKTGKRVIEVGDELDTILAADISADQTRIALGGPSKVVRVYNTRDGSLAYELRKHTDWIDSLEFSPDGVLLATGDRNGGLFVWETDTGREYLSLKGHRGAITGMSWRLDSNILASCSKDATIRLWEMENGRQVKSWGAHGGGTEAVEFTRDGRLVSAGRDRRTKLWTQAGKAIRTFEAFSDFALRVTYSDTDKRVIAGDWTGVVRVWDEATGKRLGELTPNPPKLQDRVSAADKARKTAQARQQQLTAAAKAAQTTLSKIQTDIAAANKQTIDLQKRIKSSASAVKQSQQAASRLSAEVAAAAKTVAALTPVIAPLSDAVVKGLQAAAKAKTDKALAQSVAGLKSQLVKKQSALAAATKKVADGNVQLKKVRQQIAAGEKQSREATAALGKTRKRIGQLTAGLKPSRQKSAAAGKALSAARQAADRAQNEWKRWQQAVEFQSKLAARSSSSPLAGNKRAQTAK